MCPKLMVLMALIGPIGPILAQNCPQWTLSDLAQISPIIVDATLVSHSEQVDNFFEATFKVNKAYKGQFPKNSYIRLTFANSNSVPSVECPKTLQGFDSKHKQIKRRHRRYLIFAKNSLLFGLEPLVSPLRRTRRSKNELQKALCSYKKQYCHQGKL